MLTQVSKNIRLLIHNLSLSQLGARVDSDAPLYQMFDKELWSGFDFEQRYPGRSELRRYFDFIDSKLNFSSKTTYNADVTGAVWSEAEKKWTVEINMKGRKSTATCKWFIPAIGFAAKGYIPKIKGMETFKGHIHHSAVSCPRWIHERASTDEGYSTGQKPGLSWRIRE